MKLVKLSRNIRLGLGSLWAHKLRSLLTALGIVFGVASVICMLAIGEGLSFEAREQIKRLGSNNIILRTAKPPQDPQSNTGASFELQYGLTYVDVERIATTVPGVDVIVPHRDIRDGVSIGWHRIDGMVVGTVPWHLKTTGGQVLAGRFLSPLDLHTAANVCVLDDATARRLGGAYGVLDQAIGVGRDVYRVVGIVDGGSTVAGQSNGDAGKESGSVVYVPLTTARARYGETLRNFSSGSQSAERVELHGAVVRVLESYDVLATARVIESLLKTAHKQADYEMVVPLQLLREKERTKRLYNMVLGLMAAISLVVGGIGIMNIMLATVTERTPEIGIRRAIGARRRDIMAQFLTETVLLSGTGGLVGILLGFGMSSGVYRMAHVKTIVTWWSVAIAFGISALVGIVFGFYPALRAANMNPIKALRHE